MTWVATTRPTSSSCAPWWRCTCASSARASGASSSSCATTCAPSPRWRPLRAWCERMWSRSGARCPSRNASGRRAWKTCSRWRWSACRTTSSSATRGRRRWRACRTRLPPGRARRRPRCRQMVWKLIAGPCGRPSVMSKTSIFRRSKRCSRASAAARWPRPQWDTSGTPRPRCRATWPTAASPSPASARAWTRCSIPRGSSLNAWPASTIPMWLRRSRASLPRARRRCSPPCWTSSSRLRAAAPSACTAPRSLPRRRRRSS
mmetsp:Transcript_11072/g.32886  ORF Transcript_11072/g.32886 Transcript_11072/m.32886 type:complete len:261 (+) Transcript_11072:94-876(+)